MLFRGWGKCHKGKAGREPTYKGVSWRVQLPVRSQGAQGFLGPPPRLGLVVTAPA